MGVQQYSDQTDRLVEITRLFVKQRLEPWPEFLAALIVGSVAHGEARSNSDIDCVFVFSSMDERIVPAEFVWQPESDAIFTIFEAEAREIDGVQIDAAGRRVTLKEFVEDRWEEGLKHDLSNTILLFDRDNSIKTILDDKLLYPENLRVERINTHFARAAYYLEPWRLQAWLVRGGLPAAHDQLMAAFEELIQLLHSYNGVWLPWRHRWLISAQKLPWTPTNFAACVQGALASGSLTEGDLLRRHDVLVQMLKFAEERLKDDSFLIEPGDAFISNHPDLGYAHNMDEWRSGHSELLSQRGRIVSP